MDRRQTKVRARYAPYKLTVRSQLATAHKRDQDAFNRWLDSIKTSKFSRQTDLPSSQLVPNMAHINPNLKQLFVVMDTCSIIKYSNEFIEFVINLRKLYTHENCLTKFIISLTVLEELDKCNRPNKKRSDLSQQPQKQQRPISSIGGQANTTPNCNEPPVNDILMSNNSPPRLFMRFIEEEMRTGQILVGELDPYKRIKLSEFAFFEIVNKDDRILECCLRSLAFINSKPRHEGTKLILVSEDNIFKAKASTFGVPSFRWKEFEVKYRNYGQKNCVPTPIPLHQVKTRQHNINLTPSDMSETDKKPFRGTMLPLLNNKTSNHDSEDSAPTSNLTVNIGDGRIPLSIKTERRLNCEDQRIRLRAILANGLAKTSEDIAIVKEVINLN